MVNKLDLLGTSKNVSEEASSTSTKETPRYTCDIMGIDLGTTNSAVSIYTANKVPTLLPVGKNGAHTIQSCVRWDGKDLETGENKFTVGADAYAERYQSNVCYSVKRIMGSGKTITLTHPVTGEKATFTPSQISAEILKAIAKGVSDFYKPLTDCIITVPAYFNQLQMTDTIEAAKLAGLNCLQILKEPTSASFVYSLLGYANSGAVLIYDLGGGTFDVTYMTFLRKDSVPSNMAASLKEQYGINISEDSDDITAQYYSRVIGTWGDMNLGGDDIDKAFGDSIIKKYGLKLSREDREKLYLRCEAFKKSGAAGEEFAFSGKKISISTTDLNNAVDKIFERTLKIIEDVDMTEVSTIVLVGGSTKSPRLRYDLEQAFPNVQISSVLDPDATVALGAGAVAKAVANREDLEYSDVLPLPIGVLVEEKKVDVCLQKNTSLPYSASRTYYTLHDHQERITIHVFQGLSTDPAKCTYLGRVTVNNIPDGMAGKVAVVLSFILNGQGRLKVVSHVDGIDGSYQEESLIIDNIFSTADQAPTQKAYDLQPADDFEYMMLENASEQDSSTLSTIITMLQQRRNLPEESDERQELETKLFEMLYGEE